MSFNILLAHCYAIHIDESYMTLSPDGLLVIDPTKAGAIISVAGRTGVITLGVTDISGAAATASPTFTGTPAAPTAAADTNTTQVATTAFVLGQASTTLPLIDGSATIGTSTRFAHADHIHPTDTSRAPLDSPTLTGTPAAPTAAQSTSTTQIATTAFVRTASATNDSASAGQVGEVISSNIPLASAVTLTSVTAKNVTSISLTAGDWDVSGEVWISIGTGGASSAQVGINTTTNAIAADSALATGRSQIVAALTASAGQILPVRPCRVSLASTTTYYLVAEAGFPSGTVTAYGNIIARRAR